MLTRFAFFVIFGVTFMAPQSRADSGLIAFDTSYFEDSGNDTTILNILKGEADARFQNPPAMGLSFGWVKNPYWIKLDLSRTHKRELIYLDIPWPLLDDINIYLVGKDRNVLQHYALGDHKNFSERLVFDPNFVVPIDFSKHEIPELYLRVKTTSSMQIPIDFWTQSDYLKHRSIEQTITGLFYGLFIVMFFYNLFIYFSTHRVAYLHYVFFVASFGIMHLGIKGTGFQFFWPNMPALNDYATVTAGSLSLLTITLLARSFLQLNEAPHLRKVNDYMLATVGVIILASLLLPYSKVIRPFSVVVMIFSIIIVVKAVIRYRQGFHEARFYLAAWIAMAASVIAFLSSKFGLLPVSPFLHNAMLIGSSLEVLLLSFALADRLNTLQLRLASANERLELEVDERTQELLEALEKLGQANSKLSILSTTDKLTGLHNRYHFDASLEQELAKTGSNRGTLSLLLIDIDHFKQVNDTWGHVVGDKALQFISDCLRDNLGRQQDTMCRYGGEEFAVILPETSIHGAKKVAETIRKKIEESRFVNNGKHIPITLSIGVAASSVTDGLDSLQLVHAADTALYLAKEGGRNRVHAFSSEPSSESFGSSVDRGKYSLALQKIEEQGKP